MGMICWLQKGLLCKGWTIFLIVTSEYVSFLHDSFSGMVFDFHAILRFYDDTILLSWYYLTFVSFSLQEDIRSLCTYVVEEYMDTFDKVDYVQTFKGLKLRFEQETDRQNRKTIDRFLSLYLLRNSCFIFSL